MTENLETLPLCPICRSRPNPDCAERHVPNIETHVAEMEFVAKFERAELEAFRAACELPEIQDRR